MSAKKKSKKSVLSKEMRNKIVLAGTNHIVQKQIVEAMWDCLNRADTSVSDILEYMEPGELPPDVRVAVFGNSTDDYEDENCIYANIDAVRELINTVKEEVLKIVEW